MTYVILAAGKGARANSEIINVPKVLLKGTDGKSLLVNTLEKIENYSQDKQVNLVTGFLTEKVSEEIAVFTKVHDSLAITLIKNEIYEQGVITSLLSGIRTIDDSVVILNGDTIYPVNVFDELRNIKETTLLVFPAKDVPDSIKVMTNGNMITRVGKKICEYTHISVGCLYLKKNHVLKLTEIINHLMEKGNVEKIIWHEMINYLIEDGEKIFFKEILKGNTYEVDTQEDYRSLLDHQRNSDEKL